MSRLDGAAAGLRLRLRVAVQRAGDAREVDVDLRGGLGLAGDDQRRARLVDEDRVDLVHDRVGVAALDALLERDGHVVAQVVEAELRVRPVGDVAVVGGLPLREGEHVLDRSDRHPQPLEHAAVPLRVALGQVVVDRDEVDAGAGERVQVERRAGDEGLPLAGLHLGDVALVEDDAAHQLHVEHALIGLAEARLAHGRERLEEEVLERLAVLQPLPELGRLGAQLVVGELLEVGLERGDVGRLSGQPLDAPALAGAQDLLEPAEILTGHRVQGSRSRRAPSHDAASRAAGRPARDRLDRLGGGSGPHRHRAREGCRALARSGFSVAFLSGPYAGHCGPHVELWSLVTRGVYRLGRHTDALCSEGPSDRERRDRHRRRRQPRALARVRRRQPRATGCCRRRRRPGRPSDSSSSGRSTSTHRRRSCSGSPPSR